MLLDMMKSVRRERAALERDRVVLSAMAESTNSYDPFYAVMYGDTGVLTESAEENEELDKLIEDLPESEEREDQIDKILGSDAGLSVDDMMGIEDNGIPEEDEEDEE